MARVLIKASDDEADPEGPWSEGVPWASLRSFPDPKEEPFGDFLIQVPPIPYR